MADAQKNKFLKFASLGLLIPHTILYTILAAIARKPDSDGNVFFGPSAVVCMELGKLIVSVLATFHRMATSPPQNPSSTITNKKHDYTAIPNRSTTTINIPDENEGEHEKINISDLGSTSADHHTVMNIPEEKDVNAKLKARQLRGFRLILQNVQDEIFNTSGFRLIPPAILYVCQNNLQVFAAGNLTPAEYQIVGQTKLAFTAIFSVIILRKVLNYQHWLSIAVLSIGTMIVQLVSSSQIHHGHTVVPSSSTAEGMAAPSIAIPDQNPVNTRTQWSLLIGTIAMLGASACSGLGGVLVEMLLKKKMHFWTTNVFLAFFSLLPATVPVLADAFYHSNFTPFRFFNGYVWGLIALNILGGIIASVSMKYADNILKNFAVAISLVGTVYLSAIVVGIPVTLAQIFGTALVIGAIGGYARA